MANWRALAAGASGIIVVVGVSVMAGQAASAAASPSAPRVTSAWSVSDNTHNCPAAVRLLQPARSAQYFAAHPSALQPDPGASTTGSFGRMLNKIASAHIHWVTSLGCRRGHPAPKTPQERGNELVSANWSGYLATSDPGYTGGAGASFLAAESSWTLPYIHSPNAYTSVFSSIWPGVGQGRTQSDSLVQDGSEQDLICSGGNCTPVYDFWTEVVPQDPFENVITSLTAAPGNSVAALAEVDPVSQVAIFELVNFSTGKGVGVEEAVPGETGGSTAEWIVERPTINGTTLPLLADFLDVNLQNDVVAYGRNWSDPNLNEPYIGGLGTANIVMTNCAGTETMAVPTGIANGTSFFDVFTGFGTVDPAGCA